MAPLGPLTTNRLTVRLDPERAARIEYWASENPLRIKSYNQLVQEALDEYIDRNTPSPNEKILNVKIPENTSSRLQALQDHGFGSTDHIVTEAISSYAIYKLKEQKVFEFLDYKKQNALMFLFNLNKVFVSTKQDKVFKMLFV